MQLQLGQLLEILGYSASAHYRSATDINDPSIAYFFRTAQKAGIRGTYLFQASPNNEILPARPAICIAEATSVDEARSIHQKLWNLSHTPFLIVLLPNQIRIYEGFNYSKKYERIGLIREIQLPEKNLREELFDFSSDSIDSGKIWKSQSDALCPDRRVDVHLLNNLKMLGQVLRDKGLDPQVAHSLIGKYVYIRYLYDRRILSAQWLNENRIDLNTVLSHNATLSGLQRLIDTLEECFNGAIFPFPNNVNKTLTNEIVSLVASTFKGDDVNSGQFHLDFEPYDFSYIPIELLSSIYEQFLRSEGMEKTVGAVYTPEPLADYLICELNSVKPLKRGMKVLDPCCGSGIFLVLAYRKLIELELAKRPEGKLRPTELRDILLESLFGVEANPNACYVTEFSLILTMLNYIDPPDLHRNKLFKFPILHNKQIFESDFFDDRSEPWKKANGFDWIIGNPPWIEPKEGADEEKHALHWINKNYKERPVTGNRISEAFSWRVIDFVDDEGCIGLLLHAKSLFNHESKKYRIGFFRQNEVVRVTNFSNLAYVLFAGRGEAPAMTMIYRKSQINRQRGAIVHYGPFIINQIPNRPWKKDKKQSTWTIIINENEVQTINPNEAETGDAALWKIAFWGTYRDKKALYRLRQLFTRTLGNLANERDWKIHQGLALRFRSGLDDPRNNVEQTVYLAQLKNLKLLNTRALVKSKFRFTIPENMLQIIPPDMCFIRRRGGQIGLTTATAPHIVMNASYRIYSDQSFVIPHPHVGISGSRRFRQ